MCFRCSYAVIVFGRASFNLASALTTTVKYSKSTWTAALEEEAIFMTRWIMLIEWRGPPSSSFSTSIR